MNCTPLRTVFLFFIMSAVVLVPVHAGGLIDVYNGGVHTAFEKTRDACAKQTEYCQNQPKNPPGEALDECRKATQEAAEAATNAQTAANQVTGSAGDKDNAQFMAQGAAKNAADATKCCDEMVACYRRQLDFDWHTSPPPERGILDKVIADGTGGAKSGTDSATDASGAATQAQAAADAARASAQGINNGDGSFSDAVNTAKGASTTAVNAASDAATLAQLAHQAADAAQQAANAAKDFAKQAEKAYKNGDKTEGDRLAAQAKTKADEAKAKADEAKAKAAAARAKADSAIAAANKARKAAGTTVGQCPGSCTCKDSAALKSKSTYGCGPKKTLLIPRGQTFADSLRSVSLNEQGVATGSITMTELQTTAPGPKSGFPITDRLFVFFYSCDAIGVVTEVIKVSNQNPSVADCKAACEPGKKVRTETAKNNALPALRDCMKQAVQKADAKCEALL